MRKVLPPESEHREGWVHHPHTKELAREAAKQTEQALVSLLAAARRSTDPEVRGAVAEYDAMANARELLERA